MPLPSCCLNLNGNKKSSNLKDYAASDNPKTSMANANATIVDIATIIENWAWDFFLDLEATKGRKNEYKGLEKDDVTFEINYKYFRLEHSEPDYQNFHPTNSKPWTLFKTEFKNNTNRIQSYSFKTERSTESVCLVCKEHGYTIGEEAQLTLKTPCEILEMNAGFKHELSFNKATENSISEVLTWGVDSNIEVPGHYQTVAELVVEEMSYSGVFTVVSLLSGRVTVSLVRRRDGALLMPVTQNICEIFKDALSAKQGKDLKQFCTIDKGFVKLVTKGKCNFNFAMKQRVVISEEPISSDSYPNSEQVPPAYADSDQAKANLLKTAGAGGYPFVPLADKERY